MSELESTVSNATGRVACCSVLIEIQDLWKAVHWAQTSFQTQSWSQL